MPIFFPSNFAEIDTISLILLILGACGVLALTLAAVMGRLERRRLKRALKHAQQRAEVLENRIGLWEAFFNFNQHYLLGWTVEATQQNSVDKAPEQFPKSVKRFSVKNCGKTRRLEHSPERSEGKNALWHSGRAPEGLNIPQDAAQFFDFAAWLPSDPAQSLSQAVQRMEEEAHSFNLQLDCGEIGIFQVKGGRIGAQAMLIFSAVSQQIHDYLQQKQRGDDVTNRLATLQMLLDESKQPVWMRDGQGRIQWGNRAYFRAADENYELLSEASIEKINQTLAKNELYFGQVPTIINGDRRILDINVVQGPSGQAGQAVDNTQIVRLREETGRTIAGYLAIFDDLPTAIAIFDAKQKLEFFNQSFCALWPLEVSFLETRPSHSLLLERLREAQILAENPDWRHWKDELLAAYHAAEPQLHIWNLPDGRTLRLIINPNPQGGVTWLYEDLTEKLQLEARYNTLIRMQGETLDHLHEGVALFGPDGRLRLANPAFGHFWGLPPQLGVEGVHINQIEAFCVPLCAARGGEENWHDLAAQITGFSDKREMIRARIERRDGRIADTMLVPLPQGQTMLSFIDVTDSVKVARALAERNEALESANRLRTDFVSHVSYELRTPLTNIIGFTDLLRTPAFGTLDARQREYLDDIGGQALELLNLVNDILDLATIDAGIMQLEIAPIDIAATMQAAAIRIEERLATKNIRLDMRCEETIPTLPADEARLRQILFNLLANAVNFAPKGSSIDFSVTSRDGHIVFQVRDEGDGIPDDILDKVFDRFEGRAQQGTRPGAGLGLSIVKSFVELHHGQVEIETSQGQGTTIRCLFPRHTPQINAATQ